MNTYRFHNSTNSYFIKKIKFFKLLHSLILRIQNLYEFYHFNIYQLLKLLLRKEKFLNIFIEITEIRVA